MYVFVDGVLRLEEAILVLEYETKSTDGSGKSAVQTHSIALNDVADVLFRKNWIKPKVEIVTHSLKAIEGLEWAKKASLVLNVNRKHSNEARDLVSKVRIDLSEKKLRDLD